LEGGGPLGELADGGVAQRLHALDPRGVRDLGGVAPLVDERAHAAPDLEHLEYADAPVEPGVAALDATLAPAHLELLAALGGHLQPERGDLRRGQEALDLAVRADAAHQPLRPHAAPLGCAGRRGGPFSPSAATCVAVRKPSTWQCGQMQPPSRCATTPRSTL